MELISPGSLSNNQKALVPSTSLGNMLLACKLSQRGALSDSFCHSAHLNISSSKQHFGGSVLIYFIVSCFMFYLYWAASTFLLTSVQILKCCLAFPPSAFQSHQSHIVSLEFCSLSSISSILPQAKNGCRPIGFPKPEVAHEGKWLRR